MRQPFKNSIFGKAALGLILIAVVGGLAAAQSAPTWLRTPAISPDGRTIAFASDRYGNFDVFVMPAEGGPARRLTSHSASELPFAFTPDDSTVLFGAARLDAAADWAISTSRA